MKQPAYPYRVFVSYSHDDRKCLEAVTSQLREMGLQVRWSGTLLPGMRFAEQIKDGISSAHIFVPILTKSVSERPWVHQEIGYALGLNVPVLPLAVGELPSGMMEELQALPVRPDLADLSDQLDIELIEQLATMPPEENRAVFQHAEFHEDRTRMLVDAARTVLRRDGPVPIRQIGAFSSFSIPDAPPTDQIWEQCDGKDFPRATALRRDLQRERQLLEDHARVAGCQLIIEPKIRDCTRGEIARRARIEILIDFLEKMPDNRVSIVLAEAAHEGNSLVIGNWFMAESITPTAYRGYLQTLGTWHAPSVLARLLDFDRTFMRLLQSQQLDTHGTRQPAIDKLQELIENLPADDASDRADGR